MLLPGLAWFAWFPDSSGDRFGLLATACGLSISLTALAALISFVLNWHPPSAFLVIGYALLLVLTIWGGLRRRPFGSARSWVLPIGGSVLLVFWRFYQVKSLVFPAWVDSPQHVLIVRRVLEIGGIPADLSPYLAVPFYYHFGFHTTAAAFAFWSNLSPTQAVFAIGQVLNAAVALSVYRLALVLWPDRRRALLAAFLVGFVSEMPAYYASWGRYTLLAGMLLLPLAMASTLELRQNPQRIASIVQTAILTAGVLLAHYFAAFLFALFLVVIAIGETVAFIQRGKPQVAYWRSVAIGVAAGTILVIPWYWRLWTYGGRNYAGIAAVLPSQSAEGPAGIIDWRYIYSLLGPTHNYALIGFGLAGLILALVSRRSLRIVVWSALLVLATSPWGLRVGPFRPDHFAIVLFLPACLLASDFFVVVHEKLKGKGALIPARLIWLGIFLMFGLWGLRDTQSVVNTSTVLASTADREALDWIDRQVPKDATFLINTTLWQSTTYQGVDGGYWIMADTGRATILPPLNYVWGDKEYLAETNAEAERASRLTTCDAAFWSFVEDYQVTNLYLRTGTGSLQIEQLRGCSRLRVLYAEKGVQILAVDR